MDFSFDEHAFLIRKGERIRVDISSSAFPFYVPHTNYKGLFSQQRVARPARNKSILRKTGENSIIKVYAEKRCGFCPFHLPKAANKNLFSQREEACFFAGRDHRTYRQSL